MTTDLLKQVSSMPAPLRQLATRGAAMALADLAAEQQRLLTAFPELSLGPAGTPATVEHKVIGTFPGVALRRSRRRTAGRRARRVARVSKPNGKANGAIVSAKPKAMRTTFWSKAARAEVSRRMKRYWQGKRDEAAALAAKRSKRAAAK